MFYKIILTVLVIVGFVFLIRFKRTPKENVASQSVKGDIPNAFRTKTSALNIDEQRLIQQLQSIVDATNVQVFPKPQLATFITLDPNLAPEIQAQLNKELMQISCDFMLVDRHAFSPIVALSVEPTANLQTLLKDLKVPLIALRKDQIYDEEKLRQLLVHYL